MDWRTKENNVGHVLYVIIILLKALLHIFSHCNITAICGNVVFWEKPKNIYFGMMGTNWRWLEYNVKDVVARKETELQKCGANFSLLVLIISSGLYYFWQLCDSCWMCASKRLYSFWHSCDICLCIWNMVFFYIW